jgi:hypothetical protein
MQRRIIPPPPAHCTQTSLSTPGPHQHHPASSLVITCQVAPPHSPVKLVVAAPIAAAAVLERPVHHIAYFAPLIALAALNPLHVGGIRCRRCWRQLARLLLMGQVLPVGQVLVVLRQELADLCAVVVAGGLVVAKLLVGQGFGTCGMWHVTQPPCPGGGCWQGRL